MKAFHFSINADSESFFFTTPGGNDVAVCRRFTPEGDPGIDSGSYLDPDQWQHLIDTIHAQHVACHGLDLPAEVPPGILAELVKELQTAPRLPDDWKPENEDAFHAFTGDFCDWREGVSRLLAQLNLTPVYPEQARLEYLRGELNAERISYAELAELESLRAFIDPHDTQLLEAAGVPEEEYRENLAKLTP